MAAGAAIGMMAVGGMVGAAGAQSAANAKANADLYNAQIATTNATFNDQATTEEVRRQQVYATQAIGQQRANYGASGVSSASGSALDVLQASAKTAALDALTIQHNGDMKSWALRSGATLDQMGASAAQTAGTYGAASALLGAGSGIASIAGGKS